MLLAQISDLHASPHNENLERLDAAVHWLCCIRPDATIISGELTDNSWSDGYRGIQVLLERIRSPLSIIPGNSDNPMMMRELLAGVHSWDGSSALHTDLSIGGIRAIGIDVTVQGERHGDIECHLDWLEEKLDTVGASKTLLFTHHHLFPTGIDQIDRSMCRGFRKFEELIARCGTRPLAVCSGHVHRPMSSIIADVPSYISGSICPANPLLLDCSRNPPATDPPSLMIYE